MGDHVGIPSVVLFFNRFFILVFSLFCCRFSSTTRFRSPKRNHLACFMIYECANKKRNELERRSIDGDYCCNRFHDGEKSIRILVLLCVYTLRPTHYKLCCFIRSNLSTGLNTISVIVFLLFAVIENFEIGYEIRVAKIQKSPVVILWKRIGLWFHPNSMLPPKLIPSFRCRIFWAAMSRRRKPVSCECRHLLYSPIW